MLSSHLHSFCNIFTASTTCPVIQLIWLPSRVLPLAFPLLCLPHCLVMFYSFIYLICTCLPLCVILYMPAGCLSVGLVCFFGSHALCAYLSSPSNQLSQPAWPTDFFLRYLALDLGRCETSSTCVCGFVLWSLYSFCLFAFTDFGVGQHVVLLPFLVLCIIY